MMLHSRTLALLAILALFAMPSLGHAGEPAVVTATGEGRVEVAPDLAWLGFGISARQPTVAGQCDQPRHAAGDLVTGFRDGGLPRADAEAEPGEIGRDLHPAFAGGGDDGLLAGVAQGR
ncbi:MAG: SIMPL domain-containing protein, partial [Vicinamibacterales bacterium]